jgi:hypothetical protein
MSWLQVAQSAIGGSPAQGSASWRYDGRGPALCSRDLAV